MENLVSRFIREVKMQRHIKFELIELEKKIEEHELWNFNEHWSRAIRYKLRCASVSASIPAMRVGNLF